MAAVVETLSRHGVMRIKSFRNALHADDKISCQGRSAHPQSQDHDGSE